MIFKHSKIKNATRAVGIFAIAIAVCTMTISDAFARGGRGGGGRGGGGMSRGGGGYSRGGGYGGASRAPSHSRSPSMSRHVYAPPQSSCLSTINS